jgi:catechol 2,3-dioxygenase-like lactoylglutathione lyase family enzyme
MTFSDEARNGRVTEAASRDGGTFLTVSGDGSHEPMTVSPLSMTVFSQHHSSQHPQVPKRTDLGQHHPQALAAVESPLIAMRIRLDHLTIPCRDRVASAGRLAELLGVPWAEQGAIGTYSPVYINARLTLDFAQCDDAFTKQHYCFQVEQEEFDAILARMKAAGVPFRSLALGPDDHRASSVHGGHRIYWNEPDGHVWELLTVSYKRQPAAPHTASQAFSSSGSR